MVVSCGWLTGIAPTSAAPASLGFQHHVSKARRPAARTAVAADDLLPNGLRAGAGAAQGRRATALLGVTGLLAAARPRRARAAESRLAAKLEREGGEGKIALVTGASSGIGKATVEALARSGQYARIFLAGHDEAKIRAAMQEIEAQSRGGDVSKLEFLPLELASLDSVRKAAQSFQDLGLPLHTLVCDAAVMAVPERRVTQDGFELQLEVNYLSHFLLVNLLLPELRAAGNPSDPARIISVSSSAHFVKSPLGFGDTSDLNLSGGEGDSHAYYPWTAYGQSKLAQVMFTYELARRLKLRSFPVVANVLDPSFVDTELQRYLPAQAPSVAMKLLAKTPQQGAATPVLLATDSYSGRSSGLYWADSHTAESLGRGATPFPNKELAVEGSTSYDERAWEALWKESARLVALRDTI
ncbi:unnamed protein product [Polarella glacialis]|uniref:Protochlorophyllide reductase n=1 Tax=Polarella glacialis TaxID=89957 RepID=A0A813ENW9_POLGL|nr:unnamed protein product [Polarella glacialis]